MMHQLQAEDESVLFNYQRLKIYTAQAIPNTRIILIAVKYNGNCTVLQAEMFMRRAIIAKEFDLEPLNTFEAVATESGSVIVILMDDFTNGNETVFARLVARNESSSIICSDANSQENFYHFSEDGMYTIFTIQ